MNLERSMPHNSSPSLSIHIKVFKSVSLPLRWKKQLLLAVTLKSKQFLLLQSAWEAAAAAALQSGTISAGHHRRISSLSGRSSWMMGVQIAWLWQLSARSGACVINKINKQTKAPTCGFALSKQKLSGWHDYSAQSSRSSTPEVNWIPRRQILCDFKLPLDRTHPLTHSLTHSLTQ